MTSKLSHYELDHYKPCPPYCLNVVMTTTLGADRPAWRQREPCALLHDGAVAGVRVTNSLSALLDPNLVAKFETFIGSYASWVREHSHERSYYYWDPELERYLWIIRPNTRTSRLASLGPWVEQALELLAYFPDLFVPSGLRLREVHLTDDGVAVKMPWIGEPITQKETLT